MTAPVIIQGSEYLLPIELYVGDTLITNLNCAGVRIKLDETELDSTESEISYGSYTLLGKTYSGWLFPLTQELTHALSTGVVPLQAEIKIGDSIIPTPTEALTIDSTILTEVW